MNSNRGDLFARLITIVDRLPEERFQALLGMEDDTLLALLQGNTDEETTPEQTIHADICVQFTLGGQLFEAVGFLKEGEESVTGEEAIRRSDNGHLVRSDDDWQFVSEHRDELPDELPVLWLATARPGSDEPDSVFGLGHAVLAWFDYWGYLEQQWERTVLVLRRRK